VVSENPATHVLLVGARGRCWQGETRTSDLRMKNDQHDDEPRSQHSRLPAGSLGLALIGLGAGAAWAHANALKPLAWALTTGAIVGTIAAIVWCAMPLLRLQRDPVLRRMGLTPWPLSRTKRTTQTDARR
jgi:hypothetical protein